MVHIPALITDLGIILGAATIVTMIFKKLRQPVVLGYILAGLLVSPHTPFLPSIADANAIQIWAEIGVIFLLFGLGLEFSFKKLKEVGGPASITGVTEVIFMLAVGYAGGKMMGWGEMDSIFLGGILSISSTTIIIRAFEELGVKNKKFASVVFGVLIVEDLVAILLLVLLSTIAVGQQFKGDELMLSSLKLVFFLIIWFVAGIFLLPSFIRYVRKFLNDEMMLILSISLCLGMVFFATAVGFSPALGAFIMGSLLAETSEGKRIEHLIEPVKSLFGAIFFVSVGMLIDPKVLIDNWSSVLVITVLTIFGKVFSSGAGALLSGQTLKHSIQTGFSLAQIGEFSFIIATLGLTLKVTSSFLYPVAVAVSVITTFTTPYLIKYSGPFAAWLEKQLPKKVVDGIYRYSTYTQTVSVSSKAREAFKDFVLRLIILAVILIGITAFGREVILRFVIAEFGKNSLAASVAFALTFLASAPFFWAMTRGKINESLETFGAAQRYYFFPYALSFFRYITASLILSIQLSIFFSAIAAASVFVVISVLSVTHFSNQLGGIYDWFEKTFVKNLHNVEDEINKMKEMPLMPWDAHLETYEISPHSPFLGKTLIELSIRERYGVSVVLIERGHKKIKAPNRYEVIYPYDKISVIGNDEQLGRFKAFIEMTNFQDSEDGQSDSYILHGHILTPDSPFIGKSIRDSEIREKTEGLVVGLERKSRRMINPDSLTVLEADDFLWIVGNKEKMKNL